MNQSSTTISLVLSALLLGCQPADPASDGDQDHGHSHGHSHDHADDHDQFHGRDHETAAYRPKDFAEAVESISRFNREIADALSNGKPQLADEAVDQLLDIARWLPEIAADSDMLEDQWNEVDAGAAELTDLLEDTHVKLQGSQSINYSATEESVQRIVGDLEKIVDAGDWNHQSSNSQPDELAVDDEAAAAVD